MDSGENLTTGLLLTNKIYHSLLHPLNITSRITNFPTDEQKKTIQLNLGTYQSTCNWNGCTSYKVNTLRIACWNVLGSTHEKNPFETLPCFLPKCRISWKQVKMKKELFYWCSAEQRSIVTSKEETNIELDWWSTWSAFESIFTLSNVLLPFAPFMFVKLNQMFLRYCRIFDRLFTELNLLSLCHHWEELLCAKLWYWVM